MVPDFFPTSQFRGVVTHKQLRAVLPGFENVLLRDIEFFRPGRIASLGDIYMNTLGTSIGILLFLVLLRPLVDSIWTLRHQYE